MQKTIIIIMLVFINLSLYVNNLEAKSKAKSNITKNKKVVNKKQSIKKKPSKKASVSKKILAKNQQSVKLKSKKGASKQTTNNSKIVNKKKPAIVKQKALKQPVPTNPPVQNVQKDPSQSPINIQKHKNINEQAITEPKARSPKVESKYNISNKTSDIIKMKKEDVYVDKSISSGEIGQAKEINRKAYGFIDE